MKTVGRCLRTWASAELASLFAALAACGVFAAPAAADSWARESEVRADEKWQYHLFHPTPRRLMRELSTDRPDVTESPYTVDAGHLQVEMSFVEYVRDEGGDFSELAYFPVNLKVGLTNDVDLQLVVTPLIDQKLDFPGFGSDSESGFGATQVRVKWNVWGNDGGAPPMALPGPLLESALAVMPFVQFPTGEEQLGFADQVEGGVIVPLAVALDGEYSLGLMAEFDVVRAAADDGYEFAFVHTASVSRGLGGSLAGFGEYVGAASTEESTGYAASLGFGLTCGLSDNVQLDGGVNVGLNREAEDFRVFAGISFRM